VSRNSGALTYQKPQRPLGLQWDYFTLLNLTPQHVTVKCQEIGSPPNSEKSLQLVLQGTGILQNSSSCYVYAENIKLLPNSVGKTTINLVEAHIVLPNVDKILNFSQEDLFQADVHSHMVDLQHLDDLVEWAYSRSYTQGIDAAKMITTLRNGKLNQQSTHWVWLIVIIIASIGCGVLWPVWIKFIMGYCPWIEKCITCTL
jgi:hypothetical protein